jgi:AcrR family transcriptional regulator
MARISKEKQEVIRKRILDVSKERFKIDGFENTSTASIASEVGIAEGTLFNYFDSKTELFFEVFGEEYRTILNKEDIILTDHIVDDLYQHFQKQFQMMFKIPRGFVSELIIASVKMARKKPERFQKLVEMDFQLIESISHYIDQLVQKEIIRKVDSMLLSEIVFGVIGYEMLLYVYDKKITKEKVVDNIKQKLELLFSGYLIGGSHD